MKRIYIKNYPWAEKLIQWVKCLLLKCDNMKSNPCLMDMVLSMSAIPELLERDDMQRKEDPWKLPGWLP